MRDLHFHSQAISFARLPSACLTSNPHDLNYLNTATCLTHTCCATRFMEMGHQSARWLKAKLRNCETMKSCFRQHIELVWQNHWHLLSPQRGHEPYGFFSCECCFL